MLKPANFTSRDLAELTPAFREKVEQLLATCRARGVAMKPHCTLIGPAREAELYAKSRPASVIATQIASMRQLGAPKLADILARAKPWDQTGIRPPVVSNVLPGRSAHVWGEAVDCHWEPEPGQASWDNRTPGNGYQVYADEARKLGLTAGHFWSGFVDSPHVQLRPIGQGPMNRTWREIEADLSTRFQL